MASKRRCIFSRLSGALKGNLMITRDEAAAIVDLPREQAIDAILALGGKAEKFDQLYGVSPSCPSGMTPTYLKKPAKKRRKKTGRKLGHHGVSRTRPEKIDHYEKSLPLIAALCAMAHW